MLIALAGLSKLANAETDIRHARRDFSPDELAGCSTRPGKARERFAI